MSHFNRRVLIVLSLMVLYNGSVRADHSVIKDLGQESGHALSDDKGTVIKFGTRKSKFDSPKVTKICVFSISECLKYACPGQKATIGPEDACQYEFGLNQVACICSPKE